MKKVWIVEEFSAGEGKWNRFPFISDSRKKDAIEFMGHYLFQEQKKGRAPVCRVVGYPLPRKTVDVWQVVSHRDKKNTVISTAPTFERAKSLLLETPGFGYEIIKRQVKRSDFSAGRLVGKIFKVKTPYW